MYLLSQALSGCDNNNSIIAATQLKHSEYQKERKSQAQETEIRGTQKEVCSIKKL